MNVTYEKQQSPGNNRVRVIIVTYDIDGLMRLIEVIDTEVFVSVLVWWIESRTNS